MSTRRRLNRTIVPLSVIFAAVAGGVLFIWSQTRAELATSQHGRHSVVDEVGAPSSMTASNAHIAVAERTAPVSVPAPASSATAPVPPTAEDERAFLQVNFEKQPVDRSWARGAESDLSDAIRKQLPPSSSLNKIECRKSICRAEIDLVNAGDYMAFIRQGRSLWDGPMSLMRGQSGDSWTMLGFFGKPGQDLPILD